MKGELPIPYIAALILAVAIIVVAAYIFFAQSGSTQNAFLDIYCKAKCFECQNVEGCEWSTYDPKCSTFTCPP